jgi:hypothetical protein
MISKARIVKPRRTQNFSLGGRVGGGDPEAMCNLCVSFKDYVMKSVQIAEPTSSFVTGKIKTN